MQIFREGIHALVETLGPDNAVRFLDHLESGPGSVARKRRARKIGLSNEDIVACVVKRRKQVKSSGKQSRKVRKKGAKP